MYVYTRSVINEVARDTVLLLAAESTWTPIMEFRESGENFTLQFLRAFEIHARETAG